MRKLNYYGIALLPLMLASCGGNFGVQPVVESTPTAYPVTFKSKDVPTSPPAEPSVETTPVNRPAVGAAMRLLRRNTAFHREDGTAIPDSKQAEEKLSFKEGDVLFLYGSKGNKLQQLKSEIHKRDSDVEIRTSEKENKKYNYKFVDAGMYILKTEKMKSNRTQVVSGLPTVLVMTVLYIIPENVLPNLYRARERCNIPATGNI